MFLCCSILAAKKNYLNSDKGCVRSTAGFQKQIHTEEFSELCLLWARAGVQMEIHTALEQESYFFLGYAGLERAACAIPAFRDTTGSRAGQIPHQGNSGIPWDLQSLWDVLQDNSTWRSHGSTTVTAIPCGRKAGTSFQTAKNFSGAERHKKWTLAFTGRSYVQAETPWKTTALLINNEMINPGFSVLEVHQEAQ